jgi:hypothetical protein
MVRDPIVEEVRAIRDKFAKQYNYDIEALVQALQRASTDAGRQIVALPPKPVSEEDGRRRVS